VKTRGTKQSSINISDKKKGDDGKESILNLRSTLLEQKINAERERSFPCSLFQKSRWENKFGPCTKNRGRKEWACRERHKKDKREK